MDDISMLIANINIGNADPILLFLPHWPARPALLWTPEAFPGPNLRFPASPAGCGFYVFF